MATESDDSPTGEDPRPSERPTAPGVGGAASIDPEAPTGAGPGVSLPPEAATGPGGGSEAPLARTAGPLTVGHDFGSRYHIIKLLGRGGMGAVYQAWDKVLEVAVAVKVIRPPETEDPETTRALEKRFKRELLLARQVTHKHVVRIHDLGEIDGTTYITMPYIQGSDLSSILKREGRLPVDRAVAIAKQIAAGLVAAHDAGIVHRDLKPANIMVDHEGDALITDFGIARSTDANTGSMTAGGAIVGTIEYMAPEQARGGPIDRRADVYAFGLILYDMLLGRRHSGHTTAVAELMSRMQQAPASARSIDPSIPEAVDALTARCLQPDQAARYQTMTQVVADLDQLNTDGHRTPASTAATWTAPSHPARTGAWGLGTSTSSTAKWLIAVGLVVAVGGGAWLFRDRLFGGASTASPGSVAPAISLAIMPFRNASSDPTLDSLGSSLSQVLGTELGQSARVRTVAADRLHQVLRDLQIAPNATLAPTELARVAEFTNARRVLWGQYTRFGEAIRIDATLQDLDRGSAVALNAMAPNESGLLTAISTLAEAVRQDLARGAPDILQELKSTAWKPSTSSFEALRFYNEGRQLADQGTHQAALKSFTAATKQDANFALAYSALARTYSTLGYDAEATQNSRRAMTLGEALPAQEKYLIAANHYRITNEVAKAIDAYETLAKASPNNVTLQFDLGTLYEQSGTLDKAREHFANVVALDPKFVEGLLARGRVEIRSGNPQASLEHLNSALTLAIQLNQDEARGNVLQAIGIAYKLLDRPDEALRHYQQSLEIKRRLGNKRGMASSLGEIGTVQHQMGKAREAEQSYREALTLRREIGDRSGTSITLISLADLYTGTLGRPDDALPLLREALQIRRDARNPAGEALVLNNIGNVYLMKGEFSEAQTYFERTLELREKAKDSPSLIADTLHNLAETFTRMGQYEPALGRYLRALELRRAAGDKRAAALESYGVGTIFDYQGRFGAAIKSKEAALQALRDLKARDVWYAEILGGYGHSLSLAGRTGDAVKSLEEALTLAKELQNPTLVAHALRFQADRLFYAGDSKAAAALAEQAIQAASKTSDRTLTLLAQASASMAAASQPTRSLAARFASLALDAEKAGLTSLAVDCAASRAEVLLAVGDRAAARQEAERVLARAETLGLRVPQARAHYVRAETMRLANDADARREYGLALRVLNDLRNDDGNRDLIKRADLAALYAGVEQRSRQPDPIPPASASPAPALPWPSARR